MSKRAALRFEILVNGHPACTSGLTGYGVLQVTLARVRRNPKSYPGDDAHPHKVSKVAWLKEHIDIDVGGLDTNHGDQYLHWLRKSLKVGDELTVRVLPTGAIDKPLARPRRLPARSTRPPKAARAGKQKR